MSTTKPRFTPGQQVILGGTLRCTFVRGLKKHGQTVETEALVSFGSATQVVAMAALSLELEEVDYS